ncbi:hypothetical protein XA68_18563 [Ophiocordyceps unilateralis]|uniref:Uncharacterized protein n=1 Tax=Ophiocordyceps unilateralis TaxID=268505 RepID=A0A2A9P307_OPHUN|nr:hypothetical protein XA68_18563 [Ophiocordyceps unilateralis]
MAPTVGVKQRNGRHAAHHADFLRRFAQHEAKRRAITKPDALNARQRAALREQLKDVRFLKPDYADGTKINIARILRKWKMYVPFNGGRDVIADEHSDTVALPKAARG